MTDRFNKSDTMDLTDIMDEAYARRPEADAEARNAHSAAPDGSSDGGEDYIFIEDAADDAPRSSRSPREPGKRFPKPLIITLAAVGVAAVVGILIFALSRSDQPAAPDASATAEATHTDIAGNVVVSGVNVGGMSYDEAMQALSAAEQKLADAIRIEVAGGEKTLVLTKDNFTYHFNTDEVLRQAQQKPGDNYAVSLIVDESSYAAAADAVAAEVDRAAEDAKVASFNADKKEMFTYQEAVSGRKLRRDDLIAQLRALIGGGTVAGKVQAKCDEVKPEITADYLRQNIRKLSSFTTESTNTANAMSNQAMSLAACNSSVIEPGEVWSFNACTGDTNLESRGYLPASVIVQGRYEIGIGGGICQSSTTIYNAGLLCGMDVVERFEHAYPSSYVDYGRDATIDYPNLDLKLQNPFGHQLFLKCWMDGAILHAEFYGLPEKDFDEIRITTEPPVYGKTNYTVKAARTYYLNGKAVRKENLPSSTYLNYGSADPEEPTTAPTTPATDPPTDPSTSPAADPPTTPSETPSENPGTDPSQPSGGDNPDDQQDPGPGEESGEEPAQQELSEP